MPIDAIEWACTSAAIEPPEASEMVRVRDAVSDGADAPDEGMRTWRRRDMCIAFSRCP